MMGKEERVNSKFIYNFRLEDRIPPNDPLRQLNKILDLGFMYGILKDKYGKRGNVSVPPPVLMKMMLLLVLFNVRSERELIRTIPIRLDWLWFLGYDIDDKIPNHSVLSKARKRWGTEVFELLFQKVLRQAVESGLVHGHKLFADASLVEADASKNSIKRISQMELVAASDELINRLDDNIEQIKTDKGDDAPRGGKYSKVNKKFKSTTDPESTIVRNQGSPKLYYKVHRSVDEAYEIITSCKTTTGRVDEAKYLEDLIAEHTMILGKSVGVVVTDSRYGIKENFIKLKKRGITTYLNDLSETQKGTGSKAGKFPKEKFIYDRERNTYTCPEGKEMKSGPYNYSGGWYEYRANKKECMVCSSRNQCTKDKNGRSLKRSFDEEYLELAREDSNSTKGRRAQKQRQHLMERSFANSKILGYKRARWRGVWRVSIQQKLVAIVQNLLKISKYRQYIHDGKNLSSPAMPKFSGNLNKILGKYFEKEIIFKNIIFLT
jgi:transposase